MPVKGPIITVHLKYSSRNIETGTSEQERRAFAHEQWMIKVGCLSQYFGLSLYAALSKEHFQRAIHHPRLRHFFVL